MLTPNGPGGRGSIPALVMRTGLIQPVDPANARRDISLQHVERVTRFPVDESIPQNLFPSGRGGMPTPMPVSPPALPGITAVAETVVATPPTPLPIAPPDAPPQYGHSHRHHWHHQSRRMHPLTAEMKKLHPGARLHGAEDVALGEWNGRPVAKFSIAASPPAAGAQSAAHTLNAAARTLYASGLAALPPELVGGPLAALMRGGAVELHFQNGVVVRTTL